MAKTRSETIMLKGTPNMAEGIATAICSPGHAVTFAYALAGVAAIGVLRIVTENDLVGKTIEDAYAVGEQTYVHVPAKGDIVQVRIPAAAAAIAKGAALKHAANGTFITGGIAADAVLEATEAVDNSGGGAEAFINAQVL